MKLNLIILACYSLLICCVNKKEMTTCNTSPEDNVFYKYDTDRYDHYAYKDDTLSYSLYVYYFSPAKIHYIIKSHNTVKNCICFISDTSVCENWEQDPSTDEDESNYYTMYPTYDFVSKKSEIEFNIGIEPSRRKRAKVFSHKNPQNCFFTSIGILKIVRKSKSKQYPPSLPEIKSHSSSM